jgi:ApaG protein
MEVGSDRSRGTNDSIDLRLARKIRRSNRCGCVAHLKRNYVETTVEPTDGRSDWSGYESCDIIRRDFERTARMYRAVTRQIEVTVEPEFLPENSSIEKREYCWSYTIVITNTGNETVQLRTRHWIITDASGRQQQVRGEGVVGKQPVLGPGERFEYTSGVPLRTASGFMTGRYQMVTLSGEPFEIDIPLFSLDSPDGNEAGVPAFSRDRPDNKRTLH